MQISYKYGYGGERQHFKELRMIHFLPLVAKLLSIKVESLRWSQQDTAKATF